MAFIKLDNKPKASKAPRKKVETLPAERGCDECALRARWPMLSTPQMPRSGNRDKADILILGDYPDEDDDRLGYPFMGSASRIIRKALPGLEMERIAYQNVVRCGTGGRFPSAREVHSCGMYLEDDIRALPLKAIIGLGVPPLNRFWPGANITRIHGVPFPVQIADKTLWYYPVFHPSFVQRLTRYGESPALSVFNADIKHFFSEVDRYKKPVLWSPDMEKIRYPRNRQEAAAILATMREPFGVDLETTELRPYIKGARLLSAAISDGDVTMAFPIEHPEAPTSWGLPFLLKTTSKHQWIAHSALMELSWLTYQAQKAGIHWVSAPFEDSMALGRIYHRRESVVSLGMLTRIHFGLDIKTLHNIRITKLAETPLSEVLPYNAIDAQASARLFDLLRDKVDDTNYLRFIDTTFSTMRMELMGLPINLKTTANLKRAWQEKANQAVARAKDTFEVQKFVAEKQEEFNIKSAVAVGSALVEFGGVKLPKTSKKVEGTQKEGKQWATDEDTLRKVAAKNKLALAVIDYREAQKNISTYLEAVEEHCKESADGRIHPSYTAMFTATTRLSCTGPNAQNFPKRRHKDLRSQVEAPPGHIMLAADMGQIDARIYGCATKDTALCDSFINDEDIHADWRDQALKEYPEYFDRLARKTNQKDEAKILKGARDIIKSDFVFTTFYGSHPAACAARTGIPLEITKMLVNRFWKRYSKAFEWVQGQRRLYERTGSIFTLCGIERHGLLLGNEIINTPIQGTTAHVVNDAQNALSYISVEHDDPYIQPRINIHDDLTFIVPDKDNRIEEYMDIIAEEMLKVRYDWHIVPFTVEFQIGYQWDDLEFIDKRKGNYHA